MSEQEDQKLRLADGRTLGFASYGDDDGRPLLYFPGLHQSRYSARLMAAPCRDLGIQLVAVDRPGMGLSEPAPDRTILDWSDDVAALADSLGFQVFPILAYCAGSPYSLACAAAMPRRVSRVSIVGGLAPLAAAGVKDGMSRPNRLFWFTARGMPGMLALFMRRTAENLSTDPEHTLDQMAASFSNADRVTLSDSEHRAVILASLSESFRNGPEGSTKDAELLAHRWGFELAEVETEVQLWHGAEDATTPLAMEQYLADSLPNTHETVLPGEGHVSLLAHHRRKILERAA